MNTFSVILISALALALAAAGYVWCEVRQARLKLQVSEVHEKTLDGIISDERLKVCLLEEQVMAHNILWIVGQYRFGNTGAIIWDLQGVFSSKEKAIAACKSSTWFVARLQLDEELPEESVTMPDVIWPLLKEAE
jgi:hypothetical protein